MVSDAQLIKKRLDESGGHSSKKIVKAKVDSIVRSPGNADKTSKSRQITPSPEATRKSKRLDKRTPPMTPMNKKSDVQVKLNTPSPLRRSDRGKKDSSSCSLSSQQNVKQRSPSEPKRKKEKTLIQVTMESERAELDLEQAGLKRKKMNARMFRAQFKKQRILETDAVDAGEELERIKDLFDACTDNSRSFDSEQTGFMDKKRDEGVVRASIAVLEESISNSQGCSTEIVRLPTSCPATENVDDPESNGSVSSNGSERCMHNKEATTSPYSKCENFNLLGTCDLCSMSRRVGCDSPKQELCSCGRTVNEDLDCFTSCKDRSDHVAAVTSDIQVDGRQHVCALCNKDGELLCCVGKGCKICYHVSCLDPSLTDILPGVWHCPRCVKKKLLHGVHSVSEGVESIWDVRQVDVSNTKGVRQTQYLVKYHGLAHIHNHWVPENQLLIENPCLVSNFNAKEKTVRWNTEWMVPHRLLMKRSLQEKIYIASSTVISVCDYEWLVKWCDLDYDCATWELDNSNFLSSSLGQNLIKRYEVRRQKAKHETNKPYTGPIDKLPELLTAQSHVKENYVLKNVNKLRECLFKCPKAVVFDNQERSMTVILSIQSMSEIFWPILLVTSPNLLSHWEAEFAQLVPSLDVVVYGGSADTRKGIRASEFYDEEGCMMVQVLLSSMESISEDLEILSCINWKGVIIDECQHSRMLNALEQIKMFSTDLMILLVTGALKDTSDYIKILSLLEPCGDFDKLKGLKPETSENLGKLKDRLSRFTAYGRTSQVSKFIEYWIPVQLSKFQLEQYCFALLSNSIPLCSSSRTDPVGVLRDILFTVRKCCDHPYLLDASVQDRLVAEGRSAAELLDIGIKASGKLQLLDVMLTEIKARDLQVLIIFQVIMRSGKSSTGDILDDYLRQRFGPNTFERVDAGLTPSKKQAAMNRFNKKETGQFVFLLENRACSPMIKLSSVDAVIVYGSDWNPSADMRALQKVFVDSKVEKIKVFRLYSPFTIEERSLILAKHNLNLDNNLQNCSRATTDTLLLWGASYLFSKLDEYHTDGKSYSATDFEQLPLDEVTEEFQSILSENFENSNSNSLISEAKLGVGSYSIKIPVLGEAKVQLKDGEESHVFWKNLFNGKDPKWKHLSRPSPRNRKRVQYWEGLSNDSHSGNDDVVKKRKKFVNENMDAPLVQVESGSHQATPVVETHAFSPEPSTVKVCNQSTNIQRVDNSLSAEVSVGVASEDTILLSDERKSLHSALRGEMTKLCLTLKLSEDVSDVVRKFLEYVMKNHRVICDPPSIVQALQLSVCWVAASITKQKVNKHDTLVLAKQLLNYQCTEEQVKSVYAKMRSLKFKYLQSADDVIDLDTDCMTAEELAEGKIAEQNPSLTDNTSTSENDENIQRALRKCNKRMKKLLRKHLQEIQKFEELWEDKRKELEKDHSLESAIIRSIHSQGPVGFDKLKLLEDRFSKKMEEHNLIKEAQLKELKAKQLCAINELRKEADLLKAFKGQQLHSQSDDNAGCPQNEAGLTSPATAEPSNQSKRPSDDEDAVCSILSAPVVQIFEDIRSAGPSKEHGCPRELRNSSNEECDEAGKIVMSNDLVSQVGRSEQADSGFLPSTGQPILASEQIIALPDCQEFQQQVPKDNMGSALQQALDAPVAENQSTLGRSNSVTCMLSDLQLPMTDEIATPLPSSRENVGHMNCSLLGVSTSGNPSPITENHDQGKSSSQTMEHGGAEMLYPESISTDVPAVENQSSSQIEAATSKPMDTVTSEPYNLGLVTDEIVAVPSSDEVPVNDDSGQLHPLVDASVGCSEAPASENLYQGGTSSQTVEHGVGEVFSHEPISQGEENLEMSLNNLDIGPSTDAAHEHILESSAASQIDVSTPQPVVSQLEQLNQAVLQLGVNAGNIYRPTSLIHPTRIVSPTNSTPSFLLTDSLQYELERIQKETEQLDPAHADMRTQLSSECDKEIEEVVSQIHKKYELKLQGIEAEYKLKRNELDKRRNKVLLNKILAEAFRSKCLDLRPAGRPAIQSVAPPSVSVQPAAPRPVAPQSVPPSRPPFINSASPSSGPHIGANDLRPSPSSDPRIGVNDLRPSRSPSIRSAAPPSIRSDAPPSIRSAAPPSIPLTQPVVPRPSRPMVINTISPAGGPPSIPLTQPVVPRPSRPLVINAISPAAGPRAGVNELRSILPHLQSSRSSPIPTTPSVSQPRAAQMPPSLPGSLLRPPQPPLPTEGRAELQGGISAPRNPSPPMRPSVPEHRPTLLPDISSTFSALELSDLEILGSVQGNKTSGDVVCLSDDE